MYFTERYAMKGMTIPSF